MTGQSGRQGDLETAVFAAGCFWGPEESFARLEGVVETEVGYTGGVTKDPTYEEVCSGRTGHAEAVRVRFDPARIGFLELVDRFFSLHDPTTRDRQGPDVGSQYRSAVFVQDEEQRAVVLEMIRRLEREGRFQGEIVTQVERVGPFYRAEDYHQRYMEKNRLGSRYA